MIRKTVLFFLFFMILFSSLNAQNEDIVSMSAGESKTINYSEKISKVAIGDPEIADVKAITSYELLINAKKEGTTSLILWVGKSKTTKKIVVSGIDVKVVISEIRALLKGIKGVEVKLKGGKIILSGEVEDEKDVLIVQNIINRYQGKILNLVKLPVQMIKINARIVEMTRRDDSTTGINWKKQFKFVENKIEGIYQIGKISRSTKIDAILDLLTIDGSAKIIARPNIIVINGKLASFHSGGKILVPLITDKIVTVEEKPYGVDLKILPYGDRRSNLVKTKVQIEVSTLDWANAVTIMGGRIPSMRDRKIETEIDVKVGTTIVIAGMLMEEEEEVSEKVFILGDIPLLGYFFSSTQIIKKKTELVVFLTPTFVTSTGEELLE